MKFKVIAGTKLYGHLLALKSHCQDADEKANTLANELGFQQWRRAHFCIAGGISAFGAETQPKGYKKMFAGKDGNTYFPKDTKGNNHLIKRISELPKVYNEQLNNLIGYDYHKGKIPNPNGYGHVILFRPALNWNTEKHVFLFDFGSHYHGYKPHADMIEITVSEYEKLLQIPQPLKATTA